MIDLPDPDKDHEIPEKLKMHNGILHGLAMSDDPAIKCLNTRNLIINLRATMIRAGLINTEIFDEQFSINTTLGKFLEYHIMGANRAMNDYTNGKTGYAIEKASAVLNAILFIVYDDRFVLQDKNSWTGRPDK
jgi:hypothetical protein